MPKAAETSEFNPVSLTDKAEQQNCEGTEEKQNTERKTEEVQQLTKHGSTASRQSRPEAAVYHSTKSSLSRKGPRSHQCSPAVHGDTTAPQCSQPRPQPWLCAGRGSTTCGHSVQCLTASLQAVLPHTQPKSPLYMEERRCWCSHLQEVFCVSTEPRQQTADVAKGKACQHCSVLSTQLSCPVQSTAPGCTCL